MANEADSKEEVSEAQDSTSESDSDYVEGKDLAGSNQVGKESLKKEGK